MKSKLVCVLLAGILGAVVYGGIALATPPHMVTGARLSALQRCSPVQVQPTSISPMACTTASILSLNQKVYLPQYLSVRWSL